MIIGKIDPEISVIFPAGLRERKPKEKPKTDQREDLVSSELLFKQKE